MVGAVGIGAGAFLVYHGIGVVIEGTSIAIGTSFTGVGIAAGLAVGSIGLAEIYAGYSAVTTGADLFKEGTGVDMHLPQLPDFGPVTPWDQWGSW